MKPKVSKSKKAGNLDVFRRAGIHDNLDQFVVLVRGRHERNSSG